MHKSLTMLKISGARPGPAIQTTNSARALLIPISASCFAITPPVALRAIKSTHDMGGTHKHILRREIPDLSTVSPSELASRDDASPDLIPGYKMRTARTLRNREFPN